MAQEIHTISDSSSQSADFSEEADHGSSGADHGADHGSSGADHGSSGADHGEGGQILTSSGPNVAEVEIEQLTNPPSKPAHTKIAKPDGPASITFPMARVRRLIKSEEDIRTTLEAAFLVNKATERFMDQFLEDSIEYVLEENRNILTYKQLSLTVANQKRYEFLADFVPQKIRAAEALSEKASAEN